MRQRLNDQIRREFALEAIRTNDADVAAKAGVAPSTVAVWRQKFAPSENAAASTMPCGTEAAIAEGCSTADAADQDPRENYMGVDKGLPPDETLESYDKAVAFIAECKTRGLDYDYGIIGPVRLADGRHVVGAYDNEHRWSADPRTVPDVALSAGTFAGVASRDSRYYPHTYAVGDSEKTLRDDSTDWWLDGKDIEPEWALRWMTKMMQGENIDVHDEDELEAAGCISADPPSLEEMQSAAESYFEDTGDYAFPMYKVVLDRDTDGLRVVKPGNEAPVGHHTNPVGFAFLSAQEAELHSATDWDDAYDRLSYAAEAYNDWRIGDAVTAEVRWFGNEDEDDDLQVIGTGQCVHRELDAEIRYLMSDEI